MYRLLRTLLVWVLPLCLAVGAGWEPPSAYAQKRRGGKAPAARTQARDVVHIKAPAIKGKAPTTRGQKTRERAVARSLRSQPPAAPRKVYYRSIIPTRQPSIVSETMDSLNDAETHVIEVEEQARFGADCTWVKVTEYYNLWDTRRVNPYGVPTTELRDSVALVLYDTAMGASWSPPLRNTWVTSHFGARGGRFHYGADLKLNIGDTIRAVWDGIVRITSFDGQGYGYYVLVRHYNGLETIYGHMSRITTEVGQLVKAGDPIGLGGSTGRSSGPHLHFEIRYLGNPINPEHIYDFAREQLLSDQFIISPERPRAGGASVTHRRVFYHRVSGGDTMYSVASRYGMTIAELAKLNKIGANAKLPVGKRLRVK